jgi:uncharacterized protein (DUF111 family)
MKILYYDCFSGISGDMNLGAMIDLGIEESFLENELNKLNLKGVETGNNKRSASRNKRDKSYGKADRT